MTRRDDDGDTRAGLRSPRYWRSIARAMVAVGSIRLAVRILLIAGVALVLLVMGWLRA